MLVPLVPVQAAVRSIASPLCLPPFLPARDDEPAGRGVSEPVLRRSERPRAAGDMPASVFRVEVDEGGSISPPPAPSSLLRFAFDGSDETAALA